MGRSSMKSFVMVPLACALAMSVTACGQRQTNTNTDTQAVQQEQTPTSATSEPAVTTTTQEKTSDAEQATKTTQATAASVKTSIDGMSSDGVVDTSDLFSDRDLEQSVDLVGATYLSLASGQDVTVSKEGTYVLVGDVSNTTVVVDAEGAKVQLVLDGANITNDSAPAIYVKNADKVFVTTAKDSQNSLSVTGEFTADGETNTDAVIFSKDDLTLNGLGTLIIASTNNGVTSKDDLKVTGGSYKITCDADALEANDSIRIADGTFDITSGKDALHSENSDDDSKGYVYILNGNFTINASDDGIQGTTYTQIDGGTITIDAVEGIEGTYVQINGGDISVSASDDGINASQKTSQFTPTIEIRGGNVKVAMGQGDTDALDSNGYLYVRGGTIDIQGQFAFDFDLGSEFTGGTITVNGEQVSEITNSMQMGGGPGGMGGRGDMGGGPGGGPGGGMGGPGF